MKKTPTLLKNSAIVFSGNMVANVSNYAFTILMARLLGPSIFAALVALLATMTIVGIPANALLVGFLKFAADFASQGELGKLRYLWASSLKFTGVFGLIVVGIAVVAAKPITNLLHIGQPIAFTILILGIPLGLMAAINRGLLQGLERFSVFAISVSAESITKVALGVALVLAGYQLNGATLAISIAGAVALLSTWPGIHHLRKEKTVKFKRRTLIQLSFLTLIITLVGTVFLNIDVIVAKIFLSNSEAGQYAAAATIAKIIPFLVSAIATVMMPRVAQLAAKNKNHQGALTEALSFTTLAGATVYLVYVFAPQFVLKILYGVRYLDAAPLLIPLGGAMLLYTLANVFLYYFLSIGCRQVFWALGVSALSLIGFIAASHSTANGIAIAMLEACAVLIIGLATTYYWHKNTQKQTCALPAN